SAPGAMTFIHGGSAHNTGIAVVGSMQIYAPKKASQVQRLELQHVGDPEAGWQVQVHYLDEHNESTIATYEFDATETPAVIDLKDEFGVSFQIKGAAKAGDQLYYQQAKTLNGADELNLLNVLADVIDALDYIKKGYEDAIVRLQNNLIIALQTINII